jgi:diketogulonate reductase-like aldo/keto reductase
VRHFCAQEGIHYQGFSLLTANRQVVQNDRTRKLAAKYGRTSAQVVLRFAQQLGMLVLSGTTRAEHMQHDIALENFTLSDEELKMLERAA